jgi:hypothetical protein
LLAAPPARQAASDRRRQREPQILAFARPSVLLFF